VEQEAARLGRRIADQGVLRTTLVARGRREVDVSITCYDR